MVILDMMVSWYITWEKRVVYTTNSGEELKTRLFENYRVFVSI